MSLTQKEIIDYIKTKITTAHSNISVYEGDRKMVDQSDFPNVCIEIVGREEYTPFWQRIHSRQKQLLTLKIIVRDRWDANDSAPLTKYAPDPLEPSMGGKFGITLLEEWMRLIFNDDWDLDGVDRFTFPKTDYSVGSNYRQADIYMSIQYVENENGYST